MTDVVVSTILITTEGQKLHRTTLYSLDLALSPLVLAMTHGIMYFFTVWGVRTPAKSDRLGFTGPAYTVGVRVMVYYRQVFLPLGFA